MNIETNIKLELGIDASKFTQQVRLNNQELEELIQRGVELALTDLSSGNGIVETVRECTKQEIIKSIHATVYNFDSMQMVRKTFQEKFMRGVEEYAERFTEKIMNALKEDESK